MAIIFIIAVIAGVAIMLMSGNNNPDVPENGSTASQEMVEVPNFTDQNSWGAYDDIVQDEYVNAHFVIEKEEVYNDSDEGTVLSQSIKAGSNVADKSTIVLKVSKGKEQVIFPVTGIIGAKYEDAKSALEKAGFTVTMLTKVNNGGAEAGVVYQASLDAGEKYSKGTTVQLIVWGEVETTTTTTQEEEENSGILDWLEY